MSKRMHLIIKIFVFKKVIATKNISASLYSILSYQINFFYPHPTIEFSKPRLLSFEEFSNPSFIPTPVPSGTQEYVMVRTKVYFKI